LASGEEDDISYYLPRTKPKGDPQGHENGFWPHNILATDIGEQGD